MRVRSILSLAVAVSLGLASNSNAQLFKKTTTARPTTAPAPAPTSASETNNPSQQLAATIAAYLAKCPAAPGAKISVTANAETGVITIMGEVLSQKQAQAMVEFCYRYPGVKKVETSLKLLPPAPTSGLQPAQALEPPMHGGVPVQPYMGGGFATTDPLPLVQPAMPAYNLEGPRMPPNAWPTYAPYPNMSRVAYPEAYPYNAFPFIGPFYPFPKVPLGWRSVKLEWEDGHWYLGRLSTPHDYWKVKFW